MQANLGNEMLLAYHTGEPHDQHQAELQRARRIARQAKAGPGQTAVRARWSGTVWQRLRRIAVRPTLAGR